MRSLHNSAWNSARLYFTKTLRQNHNFSNILNSLIEMERTDKCELFYFDE